MDVITVAVRPQTQILSFNSGPDITMVLVLPQPPRSVCPQRKLCPQAQTWSKMAGQSLGTVEPLEVTEVMDTTLDSSQCRAKNPDKAIDFSGQHVVGVSMALRYPHGHKL